MNRLLIIAVAMCFSCNSDKKRSEIRNPKNVFDKSSVGRIDTLGYSTVKWNYYCFYAAYQEKNWQQLESHIVHPTLFTLQLTGRKERHDTVRYSIRREFTSTRYSCFRLEDSIEIAMVKNIRNAIYIKEFGEPYIRTFSLNGVWLDDSVLVKVDSFLNEHWGEVNPWFRRELQFRGIHKPLRSVL